MLQRRSYGTAWNGRSLSKFWSLKGVFSSARLFTVDVLPTMFLNERTEKMSGKKKDVPRKRGINVTFKQAPKAKVGMGPTQRTLLDNTQVG